VPKSTVIVIERVATVGKVRWKTILRRPLKSDRNTCCGGCDRGLSVSAAGRDPGNVAAGERERHGVGRCAGAAERVAEVVRVARPVRPGSRINKRRRRVVDRNGHTPHGADAPVAVPVQGDDTEFVVILDGNVVVSLQPGPASAVHGGPAGRPELAMLKPPCAQPRAPVSETLKETSYSTSGAIVGNEVSAIVGGVMSWRTRLELGAKSAQKLLHAPAAW